LHPLRRPADQAPQRAGQPALLRRGARRVGGGGVAAVDVPLTPFAARGRPMFDLKPLNPDAIPKALQKAERYRLLNEPEDAGSICLDVLAVDPDHADAVLTLLLALTDQFGTDEG